MRNFISKKKKIILLLVVVCFIFFIKSFFLNNPDSLEKDELKSLIEKHDTVIAKLNGCSDQASYDQILEDVVVNDNGIDFYFDDNGLRNIEISNGLAIEILDYSYEKGTITKIAVRVGDGTEFAKNIYTLKNMNHPKAFYFGSNAQQIDKRIHENISNKEIIQIVRRGEALQNKIKKILDES